jgi:hypothetical protein
MARLSKKTRSHDVIRRWAEERGGQPAAVRDTKRAGDPGIIRIDFPGYGGGRSLKKISWDEFFDKFDENNLMLVFQDQTSRGEKSNFNKVIKGGNSRGSSRSSTTGSRASSPSASRRNGSRASGASSRAGGRAGRRAGGSSRSAQSGAGRGKATRSSTAGTGRGRSGRR